MDPDEEGVDLGGPKREFLHLLFLEALILSPMLEGRHISKINLALDSTGILDFWINFIFMFLPKYIVYLVLDFSEVLAYQNSVCCQGQTPYFILIEWQLQTVDTGICHWQRVS